MSAEGCGGGGAEGESNMRIIGGHHDRHTADRWPPVGMVEEDVSDMRRAAQHLES